MDKTRQGFACQLARGRVIVCLGGDCPHGSGVLSLLKKAKLIANREACQMKITPTASFKENLALLPSIEGIARLELIDGSGEVVSTIENQPGKQGSLAVYQYLRQAFGVLNAEAAEHGIAVFAEHSEDAKNRPGAHPNIDRLLEIIGGSEALSLKVIGG